MLTVDNLHVGYNPGLHILRGVNIIAPPGRATAVLGANGVGKSTLLKAVFGMLKPTQGRILLDNAEITGTLPHRMIDLGIAYGPQQPGIFSEMSVEENVALGGWRFRRDTQTHPRQTRAKLPALPHAEGAAKRPRPACCPADSAVWLSSPVCS